MDLEVEGNTGVHGEVTLWCDDAEQGERSVEALCCERAGGHSEEGARTARATVGEWCGEECSDAPPRLREPDQRRRGEWDSRRVYLLVLAWRARLPS